MCVHLIRIYMHSFRLSICSNLRFVKQFYTPDAISAVIGAANFDLVRDAEMWFEYQCPLQQMFRSFDIRRRYNFFRRDNIHRKTSFRQGRMYNKVRGGGGGGDATPCCSCCVRRAEVVFWHLRTDIPMYNNIGKKSGRCGYIILGVFSSLSGLRQVMHWVFFGGSIENYGLSFIVMLDMKTSIRLMSWCPVLVFACTVVRMEGGGGGCRVT